TPPRTSGGPPWNVDPEADRCGSPAPRRVADPDAGRRHRGGSPTPRGIADPEAGRWAWGGSPTARPGPAAPGRSVNRPPWTVDPGVRRRATAPTLVFRGRRLPLVALSKEHA